MRIRIRRTSNLIDSKIDEVTNRIRTIDSKVDLSFQREKEREDTKKAGKTSCHGRLHCSRNQRLDQCCGSHHSGKRELAGIWTRRSEEEEIHTSSRWQRLPALLSHAAEAIPPHAGICHHSTQSRRRDFAQSHYCNVPFSHCNLQLLI